MPTFGFQLRRGLAPVLLGALTWFAGVFPAPSATASAQMQRYDCDLHGENAEMVALVERVAEAGLGWRDTPAREEAVVSNTVITNLFTGELRSPSVHYIFTGRNKFADFTDLVAGRRFRAQLNALPDGSLIVVLDPFGTAPVRTRCELKGKAAAR